MRLIAILLFLNLQAFAGITFEKDVQPFLKQYCTECHNHEKQKGKLNLETLKGFETNLKSVDIWQEIAFLLEDHEMPPEDEAQPSDEDRSKMITWINTQIQSKMEELKQSAFTHMRRLNKNEYDRTLGDLLKLDTTLNQPSKTVPADDVHYNFKNNGKALQMSSFHLAAYVDAAQKVLDKAIHFGDQPEAKTEVFRPPYSKSRNVLKAARAVGKDKFMDLLEQRSFAFHPEQLEGVAVSGYYKVTAKVRGMNRVHSLNPKGFPIPQDRPLRASIVLSDPKTGDSNYFTSSDKTAEEFILPDEEDVVISGRYWIEKGYTAKIGFPTSVPRFKPAKAQIPKSKEDREKYKDYIKSPRPGKFNIDWPQAAMLMQKHGPSLRVYEFQIEGPFYDQWPRTSHENLFGKQSLEQLNLNNAVDQLAQKAFRRPLESDDTANMKTLMKELLKNGFSKEEALKAGLASVLSSPQFLYLKEKKGQLDDYALASRLSYFLWSTMPDEELIKVAKSGKLSNPKVLKQQIQRMIESPKIDGFVSNFADSWLELNKLGSMPPDRKQNLEYYLNDLESAGRQETLHYIKDLLINNGKITQLIDSDYTFMNRGLASFYGQKNAESYTHDAYVKTPLKDARRGGLLGHMSILTATANGIDTSPILRGMWVLHNFFGEHPEAPPGVPAVEPDVRGAKTIRELLEKHRNDNNCMSCHKKIDPPGFALENFDHIGRWRNTYNEHLNDSSIEKLPVDAKGSTSDGQKFNGIVEFKKILMNKKGQFTETLTEKLLNYATGRKLHSFEKADLEALAEGQENFKDLVIAVVQSDLFKRK